MNRIGNVPEHLSGVRDDVNRIIDLHNKPPTGLLLSDGSVKIDKRPDGRYRLSLGKVNAQPPASTVAQTFSVTFADVSVLCGCVDNGTGTSFVATGSINGTYTFDLPAIGDTVFVETPTAIIEQVFFDGSVCGGDPISDITLFIEIGIHRIASDRWRVEAHANEILLFDSVETTGPLPLELANTLECGGDYGPGLFAGASGGTATISAT